jgi:hypothetical protein
MNDPFRKMRWALLTTDAYDLTSFWPRVQSLVQFFFKNIVAGPDTRFYPPAAVATFLPRGAIPGQLNGWTLAGCMIPKKNLRSRLFVRRRGFSAIVSSVSLSLAGPVAL